MGKKKTVRWALIGLSIVLASIYAIHRFIDGYLIQTTEFEDGTAIGGMRTPDITDLMIFLILIGVGLTGFIVLMINSVKLIKKGNRQN